VRRITFFGGAFDPPHMGHYLAAAYFLASDAKDPLWLVPSFHHPYGKHMQSFTTRLRWCQMLAKQLGPRCSVSAIEKEIDGKSTTYAVVQAMKRRYPKTRFRMIVGADAFADRHNWYMADALLSELEFFAIGRGERSLDGHLAMPDVSSTEIRARLKNKEPCDGLVPAVVLADVIKKRLYRV
jgi:nicotinate-nucleotide adenylyltransferase